MSPFWALKYWENWQDGVVVPWKEAHGCHGAGGYLRDQKLPVMVDIPWNFEVNFPSSILWKLPDDRPRSIQPCQNRKAWHSQSRRKILVRGLEGMFSYRWQRLYICPSHANNLFWCGINFALLFHFIGVTVQNKWFASSLTRKNTRRWAFEIWHHDKMRTTGMQLNDAYFQTSSSFPGDSWFWGLMSSCCGAVIWVVQRSFER